MAVLRIHLLLFSRPTSPLNLSIACAVLDHVDELVRLCTSAEAMLSRRYFAESVLHGLQVTASLSSSTFVSCSIPFHSKTLVELLNEQVSFQLHSVLQHIDFYSGCTKQLSVLDCTSHQDYRQDLFDPKVSIICCKIRPASTSFWEIDLHNLL